MASYFEVNTVGFHKDVSFGMVRVRSIMQMSAMPISGMYSRWTLLPSGCGLLRQCVSLEKDGKEKI